MKKLLLDFFWNETLHIAKEGGQWAVREPTSPVAATRGWRLPGLWGPGSSPLVLLSPSIFIYSQKIPRIFSGHLELCRIEDSDLLLFQSRIPAA